MTDLLAMERPPAINTYGYLWSHRADEAVAILASNGYREFELMLQPPHMSLDPQSAEARNLAAQVRDRSIVLHALNMPSLDQNLASAMPEMRSYTLDLFIRQIRLAGAIGARRIVVAPGRVSPLFPAPRDMLRQWLLDALAALLPVAKSEGVVLAIETCPLPPCHGRPTFSNSWRPSAPILTLASAMMLPMLTSSARIRSKASGSSGTTCRSSTSRTQDDRSGGTT